MALPVQAGLPQVNVGGTQPNITPLANEMDVALHAPRTVIDCWVRP